MSKYNRTHHLPFSPGNTSDDKVATSVEPLLGIETVITEKLDGENCCLVPGGVYARSHAVYTRSAWSSEVRKIHSFIRHQLPPELEIFGENMEGIHSIAYTNLGSYFYTFGIRELEEWHSWDDTVGIVECLDLKVVPLLYRGIFKTKEELEKKVLELVKLPSILGGEREGIVIRNAKAFPDKEFQNNVMKWVRPNHVQTDKHWRKNWKKAKLNAESNKAV